MIHKSGLVHLIRPGALFAELPFLLPVRGTYDGFIINAPTIATAPQKVADFLRKFSISVPFLIDPKTYVLAMNPEAIKTKKSWKRLLEAYGLKQEQLPIGPNMTDSEVRSLAAKTLEFQSSCFPTQQQSFLVPVVELTPKVLVAPYFLLDGTADPLLETNLRLLSAALEMRGTKEVLAVVLINQDILTDQDQVDAIGSAYASMAADGYLLWVNGTSERSLTSRHIYSLRNLIAILRGDQGRPVINMFGGYLSALLNHHGLSGFCHSATGGESRAVNPPTGGPVDVFYYVPHLHGTRPAQLVEDYLDRIGIETGTDFTTRICNCQICSHAVREGLDGFTTAFSAPVIDLRAMKTRIDHESKVLAALHYMLVREREIRQVQEWTLRDLIGQLSKNAGRYRDPANIKSFDTTHLREWARGLTEEVS